MDHANNLIDDTLAAMKRQDKAVYATKEGIYDEEGLDINGKIRCMMVDWYFRIADFCKYDRDTVAIAVNHLDRCVARQPHILNDARKFQLVAVTCFYTAIKIHEPEIMPPQIMASLGKGIYSIAEIEEMELEILKTLEWRVNPPTPMSFATKYLDLVDTDAQRRRLMDDLVHRQVDYATKDSTLLGIGASAIALAAVSNAIQSVEPNMMFSHGVVVVVVDSKNAGLAEALSQGCGIETSRPKITRQTSKRNSISTVHLSPRCIAMER